MADPWRTTADALKSQAGFCARLGSPFSAIVLELIAENVDGGGCFLPLFDPWRRASEERYFSEAVALRALGGLHDLVLDGADAELAACYPPDGPERNRAGLAQALDRAALTHRDRLQRFMTSPPQTNEVRRTTCLLGGFLTVAEETGLPLRCLEIGASAGLNLNWDRYRYDLGPAGGWGDPDAALTLSTTWRGPPPPLHVRAQVVERAGCDQNPIDPRDTAQARRLQAYVWADQTERLAALRSALAIAQAQGVPVERADAAAWVGRRMAPVDGVATVLYHSIVWQYLEPRARAEVTACLEAAGATASRQAPLAWVRMEPTPEYRYEVRLTTWPSGQERLLAEVHAHGAEVDWAGPPR